MSTQPWGTMNGWLRLETEQRGAWTRQRVQDLRSARLPSRTERTAAPSAAKPAQRPASPSAACAGAA
nr:hypothetical protein [Propionicimonas sp.]